MKIGFFPPTQKRYNFIIIKLGGVVGKMMNLAEDISNIYHSLEQDISWSPKLIAIVQKVLPFIRHRSTAEKLSAEQYQRRLYIAANFFRQLEAAIPGIDKHSDASVLKTKRFIWEHQSISKIKNYDSNVVMDKTAFKPCLANYLAYLPVNLVKP